MADTDDDEKGGGYKRPPKASQFKKGQSGNPRGRPKKARGYAAIAARVLGERQRLAGQPRGARVRYSTLEMIVMTLKQLTAAGHERAAKLYTRLSARFGTQETTGEPPGYLIVVERCTCEEWEALYSPKEEPPPFNADEPD